jgi:hypothetical protein
MNASATQEAQFSDSPEGWAQRLAFEFEAARKHLKPWHEEAAAAVRAYLNEADLGGQGNRYNLFTADTQTQEAILFGNPPRASVSRRYADAQDDVARVASVIQERLLNADVECEDDTFTAALGYAHWDRQVASFGLCRVRYEVGETETTEGREAILGPDGTELAPAVPPVETRPNEKVETDWVHWSDVLWGPCRVWHEVPWLAFAADISRRQAQERFGEDVANELPVKGRAKTDDAKQVASPWDRVRVWDVWVKDARQVFRYVEGYPKVLVPVGVEVEANGGQPDPLGLEGFFPCPKPLLGNVTTSKLVPKTDWALHKELYSDVNDLAERIHLLEDAIGVKGAYNSTTPELSRLVKERGNVLVPVANWAALAEKGGMRGSIDWFPLEQVVSAIVTLQGRMNEKVEQLRQLTGMSDIMRGQPTEAGATATEIRARSRFGSVRMEKRQKELARFASDLHRLRAEVMAKHFAPETYLARSNMAHTPDAALAPQAVQLLQSDVSAWRIEVKPETISMTDFDSLKQERTEVLGAIGQYLQVAMPAAQQMPGAAPELLELLQSAVAGLRGAGDMEGILDRAIAKAEAAAQQAASQPQQPQDNKLQVQALKGQQDMQKVQAELQADLMREQAKVQADAQREQTQAMWNSREHAMKTQISEAARAMHGQPGGPQGGMP